MENTNTGDAVDLNNKNNSAEDEGQEVGLASNLFAPTSLVGADRTCLGRWFGRMDKGSFRAGIFSLTATAIGGGNVFVPRK